MKFLRNTILQILIITTLLSLITSLNSKKNNSKSKTSHPNTLKSITTRSKTSNGKITDLGSHNLSCSSASALSFFVLNHRLQADTRGFGGYKIEKHEYTYNCLKSQAISGKKSDETQHYTPYGTYNKFITSNFSVNYLDKHAVMCGAGEVLTGFHLTEDHGKKNVRYDYKCTKAQTLCCKDHTNNATSMEGRKTFTLQHQKVGSRTTKTHVLKGFKLWSNHDNEEIWYKYRICKLKDMDAEKKVEEMRKNHDAANANLALASADYENMMRRVEEARKKVADLEAEYTVAKGHEGLEASC